MTPEAWAFANAPIKGFLQMLSRMPQLVSDLIYPRRLYCNACHKLIDKHSTYGLCADCLKAFVPIDIPEAVAAYERYGLGEKAYTKSSLTCEKCGRLLHVHNNGSLCYECRDTAHHFDQAWSCFRYEEAVKRLMREYKYSKGAYIGKDIAQMMYERLMRGIFASADRETGELIDIDVVIAVPMGKKKELQRGYNQAVILAKQIAKLLRVPYDGDVLKRRAQDNTPMSSMTREERKSSLQGAFELCYGADTYLAGKNILLVDDVYTTGSTLDACSEELRKTACDKVFAITFTIGADMRYVDASATNE
jgi:ComF family protein